MNLALNCWFSECYNTRILTAKLSPCYFTCLLFNLRFIIEQQDLLQTIRLFSASEKRDAIGFIQQLSTTSFEACELEITVNYFSVLETERQFHAKHNELNDALLACPPDWAQGPPLLRAGRGLPLPGSGQLYPPFGFSLADCRRFQVTNPCWAIHSMLSVHHTALADL